MLRRRLGPVGLHLASPGIGVERLISIMMSIVVGVNLIPNFWELRLQRLSRVQAVHYTRRLYDSYGK